LHNPKSEQENVWTRVQLQYVEYLKDWRKDLGGKKNFHNGKGIFFFISFSQALEYRT